MPFEPGPETYTAIGAFGIAVTALWRRLVAVEDRAQQDKVDAINAMRDAAEAIKAQSVIMARLVSHLDGGDRHVG